MQTFNMQENAGNKLNLGCAPIIISMAHQSYKSGKLEKKTNLHVLFI